MSGLWCQQANRQKYEAEQILAFFIVRYVHRHLGCYTWTFSFLKPSDRAYSSS